MPLQTQDFSWIGQQKQDMSGLRDLFQNYYKGYEMGQMPQKLEREKQRELLQQQILGTQAKYAEPFAQQDLRHKEITNKYLPGDFEAKIAQHLAAAEASKNKSKYGEMTGTMGNLIKLHHLKQQADVDPELIKQLESQVELDKKREQGIYDYQQSLIRSQKYRSSPPLQKTLMDIDALDQGVGYTVNGEEYELTPPEQSYKRKILTNDIIQKTTDAPLRDRLRAAEYLDTTFNMIDPDKAFQYSGGFGAFAKAFEKGKGALSKEQSEEYKQFEENLTTLKVAAKQASRFFDLAAAEKIQRGVDELLNPEDWTKNPEVAKAKFKALKKLFETEYNVMLKQAINPGTYGFEIPQSQPRNDNAAISQEGVKNYLEQQNQSPNVQSANPEGQMQMIVGITPSGKKVMVPADRLDEFLSKGGKRG